ncbi:MAG: amino acid adenylation domain-containing protein, partial [Proteobacteria bacterium]|nr:amino acid adenylation domain-containing protein [Pseudomonadota bacterium]
MIAAQLLKHLSSTGIRLWEEEGKLRFRAPKGAISNEIREELSNQKYEIISLLRHPKFELTSNLPQVEPDLKNRNQPFSLSDIQSAYLIGRDKEFELGNVACHAYYELECSDLDLDRLGMALNQLIKRHEALRLVFMENGTQKILEDVPEYQINALDLRGHKEKDVENRRAIMRKELSHKIHDAGKWPIFDLRAIILDNSVCLYFSFDLLVADFFSAFIMFRDLVKLYDDPDLFLEPIDFSFRDYVLAELKLRGSELFLKSRDYWMNRANSFPSAPQLPFIKAPSTIEKPEFIRRKSCLDENVWKKLKDRGSKAQLTPSVVLMAAYAEVLSKWSRNSHFAINLTLFNRLPLHPQIMDVAGDFTVVSLLEVNPQHQDSFEKKARLIQKQLWEDMDNRYFSGVNFIRELARIRGDKGKALMPVVFSSMIGVENANLTNFNLERLGTLTYGITQTPQVCLDHQVIEHEGKLLYIWDAVEELFPKGLLDDMFDAYTKAFNKLAYDEKAWNELSSELISVKPPEHLAMGLETDADLSSEMLHTLFEKQASLQPEKEAVVTSAERITYGELKICSDEIGGILRKEGALPNTLVAVVMEKGWEQIAGALGVLKSGAAYLPVDPKIPGERLEHLLHDGRVDLVLTQSRLEKKIKWPDNLKIFSVDTIKTDDSDATPFEFIQRPDDLAYVIYTSGSTGTPKGVMIDHMGAVNTVLDVNRKFSVNTDDRVFALAAMDFDLSVYDIFGTLAAGGTIVIPEPQGINDPAHWTELMTRECVTVWNSVPQLMQMLTEYSAGRKETASQSLRLVLMSGDWIPLKLPETIKSLFSNVDIYSLGGATEASIWSIYYPVKNIDPEWKSIPYGRSMTNQKFYVLNENLEHCPDWVTGNLYIGGVGLAKGYWRDKKKTSASFIKHPKTGERLYRTGDLGRYLSDGNIEFQGREDFQVKISGYRIELGEIEATIKNHPAVKDAVVSVTGNQCENNRLTAYVVPNLEADSALIKTEQADPVNSEALWASIKTVAQLETGKDFKAPSPHSFSIFHEYMEKISIEYICHALNDLGIFIHPNEKHSLQEVMQKGKIHVRFRSLTGQWLDLLAKKGVLKKENNYTYTNPEKFPVEKESESLPREIEQSSLLAEGAHHLNLYLQRVRKHFKNLLQGEIEPLELFFNDDDLISPEKLTQLMTGT